MINKKVVVIDYGMGNIWSVVSALKYLGYQAVVSADISEIRTSDSLVLPGVGSFRKAMNSLRKLELDKVIIEEVMESNKLFLGICLGMQMLFKDLNEGGNSKGFGFFSSEVLEISKISKLKTNIGWRKIKSIDKNFLENENYYYFCHSYYVNINDEDYSFLKCVTEENPRIPAIIQKNNIFGLQFHPEKSQKKGIMLIKKFLEF